VPAMIEQYLRRLAERRGEVTAEIIVAQPLDEARRNALDEQLRRAVGARVAVDVRVDPSLLGGMIVKVGSRMVDSSLSSRLQRLRLAMKAAG
jgi:F-type H+-transporting ATPase subunit delta